MSRNFLVLALMAMLAVATPARAAPVIVGTDGDPNALPFSILLTRHYQEVFAHCDFPFTGPAELTGISFCSPFCRVENSPVTFTKVHIDFSTTSKHVTTNTCPGLCFTFQNNIGSDDTTVLCGCFSICNTATPFSLVVPFSQPFCYDPCSGNLLMNIEICCCTKYCGSVSAQGAQCCCHKGLCGFDGTLSRLFTEEHEPGSDPVADFNSTTANLNGAADVKFNFVPSAGAVPEITANAALTPIAGLLALFLVLAEHRRKPVA